MLSIFLTYLYVYPRAVKQKESKAPELLLYAYIS
jgi:hypothetical protein